MGGSLFKKGEVDVDTAAKGGSLFKKGEVDADTAAKWGSLFRKGEVDADTAAKWGSLFRKGEEEVQTDTEATWGSRRRRTAKKTGSLGLNDVETAATLSEDDAVELDRRTSGQQLVAHLADEAEADDADEQEPDWDFVKSNDLYQ